MYSYMFWHHLPFISVKRRLFQDYECVVILQRKAASPVSNKVYKLKFCTHSNRESRRRGRKRGMERRRRRKEGGKRENRSRGGGRRKEVGRRKEGGGWKGRKERS